MGIENIFKPTTVNKSLQQDNNDNVVRIVNFATSKSLFVKNTMLLQRNILKYTWTPPDGKANNNIDHMLIDSRWNSSMLDVRSFKGANCDTRQYLVVAKVRERLAVSK